MRDQCFLADFHQATSPPAVRSPGRRNTPSRERLPGPGPNDATRHRQPRGRRKGLRENSILHNQLFGSRPLSQNRFHPRSSAHRHRKQGRSQPRSALENSAPAEAPVLISQATSESSGSPIPQPGEVTTSWQENVTGPTVPAHDSLRIDGELVRTLIFHGGSAHDRSAPQDTPFLFTSFSQSFLFPFTFADDS